MTQATQIELKGFSRTIAELEWLLLILVLLYFAIPSSVITDVWGLILAMIVYASFVLSFRYSKLFTEETHWKLAVETWGMFLFITWSIYNSGGIESPLFNLYVLVIIVSALTLGKITTVLEVFLIAAVYFYLGQTKNVESIFSMVEFGEMIVIFVPVLLVGYVTTLLAADIQYAREELILLSDTDELTGLKNRRSFKNELSNEVKKGMRYKRPFSIMMLDADNLKQINDQYGHSIGDKLIVTLAQTIQDSLRSTDVLARYGGDEFVAMLPETDEIKTIEVAERIRLSVENTSFSADGDRVSSTLSIGIACYPTDSDDSEDIINKADQALYESKRKGRNLVSHQPPTAALPC
jgi:diguanylate cyclase (GGDEF)-like protein